MVCSAVHHHQELVPQVTNHLGDVSGLVAFVVAPRQDVGGAHVPLAEHRVWGGHRLLGVRHKEGCHIAKIFVRMGRIFFNLDTIDVFA